MLKGYAYIDSTQARNRFIDVNEVQVAYVNQAGGMPEPMCRASWYNSRKVERWVYRKKPRSWKAWRGYQSRPVIG